MGAIVMIDRIGPLVGAWVIGVGRAAWYQL